MQSIPPRSATTHKNKTNAADSTSQSVTLETDAHVDVNDGTGSLTLGASKGVGGNLTLTVLNADVQSVIGDSADVAARGAVNVDAFADQDVLVAAAAASVGGNTGFGGAGAVYVQSAATRAAINANATVDAGNVLVSAVKDSTIDSMAGGVAIGGTTAVGGGIVVTVITDTTEALVGQNVQASVKGITGATFQGRCQRDFQRDDQANRDRARPAAARTPSQARRSRPSSAKRPRPTSTKAISMPPPGATTSLHPSVRCRQPTRRSSPTSSARWARRQRRRLRVRRCPGHHRTRTRTSLAATVNATKDVIVKASSVEDIASVVVGGSGGGWSIAGRRASSFSTRLRGPCLGDDPTDELAPPARR